MRKKQKKVVFLIKWYEIAALLHGDTNR